MKYKKAKDVLPQEILELIQNYVDGEYIYIPRKDINKKTWGECTSTKNELKRRNNNIYYEYKNGVSVKKLAIKYFLSEKSIQRIVCEYKKKEINVS